jgi:hypothetical protein
VEDNLFWVRKKKTSLNREAEKEGKGKGSEG